MKFSLFKPAKRNTNANHVWSNRKKPWLIHHHGPICQECKQKFRFTELEVDHIDGNSSTQHVNNLQLLCKPCHREKTAKEQRWGSGRSQDGVRILIARGYGKQQRLPMSKFRPFRLPRVSIRAVAKEVGVSHVALSKAWKRHIEQGGQ
jgi:hypothetical protein